jgi:hypothetical protein
MNQRPEEKLTTADMAAAAEPRRAEPTGGRVPVEHESGRAGTPPATSPGTADRERDEAQASALFATEETQRFRESWDDVQTGFVDEPRQAVERADSLVAEVMKRLAEIFADERRKLEGQWSRVDEVSTEELRLALRRYRSFFDRLLSYGGQPTEPRTSAEQQPGGQVMDAAAPAVAGSGTTMPAAATTARWEDEEPRFRARWEQRHGTQGESWEDYEPCYRYAWEMHNDPRYRDRTWQEVEPDLRRDWEQRHPDTPWDRVMNSIRDTWDSLTGAPAR